MSGGGTLTEESGREKKAVMRLKEAKGVICDKRRHEGGGKGGNGLLDQGGERRRRA